MLNFDIVGKRVHVAVAASDCGDLIGYISKAFCASDNNVK